MGKLVPISLEQLGHFSIDDEDHRLYWDGQAIQTESRVVLSGKQIKWAVAIAIATIFSAFSAAIYTGFYVRSTLSAKPAIQQTAPAAHSIPKSIP
jgi:hypothetical protein